MGDAYEWFAMESRILFGLLKFDLEQGLEIAATVPALPHRSGEAHLHQLGRYIVIRTIGVGGMGVVYSAYDEELDRRVAIKLLRTEISETSRNRGLSRMRREAQALAKLSHPNVVQVYDVGEFRNQLFLAMEYVRGRTLGEWLKAEEPDLREIVEIFLQAGRGLAAAHAAGLVHRDFKPDNVIVGDDGRVRVLDFGVARADASDDEEADAAAALYSSSGASIRFRAELTEAGMIIGTPAYMAPEQFESRPTDARTDIFGFSVALYEALYGHRPFRGAGVEELKVAVLAGELAAASDERGVPARIHRILVRGLRPSPSERYQSMEALLEELSYDPSVARRRIVFIALITLAVVALLAAAISLTQSSDTRPSCDAAASELEELYNPERRARIGAGILRSAVPFAGSTWERVAPRLDDYAEAWSSARLDACEAHREGRQSPRLFDLRTACLDQRRAGFAALLEVFESADDSTIPKLAEAVLALPRLEPCADTEALTSAIPPPEDAATAETVQRLRERLAEVKAYESAGQYQQAVGVIDALQAEADALPYAPIKIEVLLRRGILAMWQFQFEAADEALSGAFYMAIAAGHDVAAADAISRRIYIQSNQDPEKHTEARRLGDALILRVQGDRELEATYYNNVGVLAKEAGETAAARVAYQKSLVIKRELYGEAHLEVAYTLSNLGALDVDEGYFQRATDRFVAAVEIFRETLGPEHFQTGALLSNLANVYARSGRWGEALESYGAMDGIFAAFPDVWSEMGPYILPDRGDFHLRCRRLDAATDDYNATLRLLGDAADGEALPALRARVGLAAIAAARGEVLEASELLSWLDSRLESSESAGSLAIAEALELKGRLATLAGDEEAALLAHRRALEIRTMRTSAGTPARARALLAFARANLALGRTSDAQVHLGRARALLAEEPSLAGLDKFALEHLAGAIALAEGDPEGALRWLRGAVEVLQGEREADDFDLALAKFDLARALAGAGEEDEARALAEDALGSLRRCGDGWAEEARGVAAWIEGDPASRALPAFP